MAILRPGWDNPSPIVQSTMVGETAWPKVSEVGGLSFHRLPGHHGVIAQEHTTYGPRAQPSLLAHPHFQITIVPAIRVYHLSYCSRSLLST